MGISESLHADPSLTAVAVVITGIMGAIIVTPLMNLTGISDFRARGFAVGIAAHGIGTARAFQVDAVAGVFSGIAMGLNALVTSFLVTLLVRRCELQSLCCSPRDLEKFLPGCGRASEVNAPMISMVQGALGLASGALVGFSLGLVGGGGSILAVPLMVYVVGVRDAHVAIGTSAIAVAANAAVNLSNHARGGTVVWSCALMFAVAGIIGAFLGSIFGKMIDGQKLLALFALLMLVIALLMLKTRARVGVADVKMDRGNTPAIAGLGLATGTLSGFFGIGGGFLIVPALMLATGMPIMNAVSSSLVAVTAFGLTTAASYAWSGLISWGLAGLFIAGGIAGGLIGTRSARLLAARRGALNIVFAGVIIAVALYMLARNIFPS
jgi:uncharacterized membrane protein YfcA